MTTIAVLLLLIGTALTGFGSLAYISCAVADYDSPRPDWETLCIARTTAHAGLPFTALGITTWFSTGASAPPPVALLLMLTALAAASTLLTRLAPPARKATT